MTEFQSTRPSYADLLDAAALVRFWKKVNKANASGCWLWTAARNDSGYGIFVVNKRTTKVHRISWELEHRRKIPAGLTLDHTCRHILCVNPAHLEAVSLRENILRGTSEAARRAKQTHCCRGHEFTKANTVVSCDAEGVHRKCRECANANARRRDAERKAKS